jgi:glycosyltransferase involved in cell wall biosynthesis
MQYGIDLKKFTIQKDFNIRKVMIVSIRAFVENSNYQLIVEILYNLKSYIPNISAVFVANGPQKSKIKEMIKNYALEQNVKILNAVDHDSLAKILNSAKIYLSLTSSDGTPLSLFEAIACGLFPVVSNIEANRDWINKGIIGEVLDFTDSEKMARKIIEIISRLTQIEYMEHNRRIVMQQMDFEINSQILNNVFVANLK